VNTATNTATKATGTANQAVGKTVDTSTGAVNKGVGTATGESLPTRMDFSAPPEQVLAWMPSWLTDKWEAADAASHGR